MTVASLPIFSIECASEKDTIDRVSSSFILQFIAGSLDRPVSTAKIYFAYSPKQSTIESYPEREPYKENQGVQAWQGMIAIFRSISKSTWAKFFDEMPRIGRPSDDKLNPI